MAGGQGVLIVSASAGAGHLRAAEALREAVAGLGDVRRVEHVDILELGPRWIQHAYGGGYDLVSSRAPWIWREIYQRTDGDTPDRARWGPLAQRLLFRAFHELVTSGDWGAVLCTHFLPGQLAAHPVRGAGLPPFFFAVTDFTLHRYWMQPGVRRYFTATESLATTLRLRTGAAADPTGIPVATPFAAAREIAPGSPAWQDARSWFGFDAARPLALVMAGGAGAGIEAVADATLAAGAGELQLAIVCGRNHAARRRLAARGLPADRVHLLGHVRSIPRLMAAADVVVSKPGGSTCAEALAVGRPLVLTRPIPGHEEANLRELVRLGAALPGTDAQTLGDALRRFFAAHWLRSQMTAAARAAGRPQAAAAIAGAIAGEILQRRVA